MKNKEAALRAKNLDVIRVALQTKNMSVIRAAIDGPEPKEDTRAVRNIAAFEKWQKQGMPGAWCGSTDLCQ